MVQWFLSVETSRMLNYFCFFFPNKKHIKFVKNEYNRKKPLNHILM